MSPWLAFMTGVITGQLYELPDCTLTYSSTEEGPDNHFRLKTRMGRTFRVTIEEVGTPGEPAFLSQIPYEEP